jgi:hypothetical protein
MLDAEFTRAQAFDRWRAVIETVGRTVSLDAADR